MRRKIKRWYLWQRKSTTNMFSKILVLFGVIITPTYEALKRDSER